MCSYSTHFLSRIGTLVLAVLCAVVLMVSVAIAQTNSNNNNNSNQGGIRIDASGVLTRMQYDSRGDLDQRQRQAFLGAIPADVRKPSLLRFVNITALEKAIIDNNGRVSPPMRYLAGLTRLQYVFICEETGDIIIGGPAEGWIPTADNHMVGIQTGRPMLELEDLVVALRAFPPKGRSANVVACSIDPTPEGLARVNAFTNANRVAGGNGWQEMYVNGLRESMGHHTVSVEGVSPKTHFAQVLVFADYRMKLLGLGMDRIPVRMVTFYDKTDATRPIKGLLRWFFVPDYDSVRMTEDGKGIELVGNAVKLVEEADVVSTDGSRRAVGRSGNIASQTFVNSFTQQYSQIAAAAPVFAQLRNCVDLLVFAAFLQKQNAYEKTGWKCSYFGDESKFQTELYSIPKYVEPIINVKVQGNQTAFPMGGGVNIEARTALDPKHAKIDDKGEITTAMGKMQAGRPDGSWYWDAPVPATTKPTTRTR